MLYQHDETAVRIRVLGMVAVRTHVIIPPPTRTLLTPPKPLGIIRNVVNMQE